MGVSYIYYASVCKWMSRRRKIAVHGEGVERLRGTSGNFARTLLEMPGG